MIAKIEQVVRNSLDAIARHHAVAVLAYFILLETLTFGHIVLKTGFYLDDWNMIAQLYLGPQNLWSMITTYFFGDPKIIIRPVEVIHFCTMFLAFGLNPLGYHLTNCVMEVLTAWLSYVVLFRLSGSRVLALFAAVVFLVYPIHDSTHYWVVASSATLSLLLYMASLWCHVEGALARNRILLALAYACFTISIFNYECYLPLFPFTVACALYASKPQHWLREAIKQSIPYVISIACVFVYGRWLVPMLGTAWVHGAQFDLVNVVETIVRGVQVSITAEPFQFLSDRLIRDGAWTRFNFWPAIIPACLTGLLLLAAFCREQIATSKSVLMIAGGFAVVLLSYTIFGLNPEYQPTLLTFVNRINYAAALGAGMLFSGLLYSATSQSKRLQYVLCGLALTGFVVFSMMSTWALSRPWTLSWVMQKHVQKVISDNRTMFHPGDSIMLLNSPRYLMWSPVFDGTWDFQNMVQVTLKDKSVKGGVISERLQIRGNEVLDLSRDYLCGKYAFNGMHALVATEGLILPVRDSSEFISIVESRGMAFGLDRTALAGWRGQTRIGTKPEVSQ